MASNAMSRIEHQDGTCLVQILLSHTFLPWSFCTEKHKITLLAYFSQKRTECESHFKWFCTSLVKSLTLMLISLVLSSSPQSAFPTFLPLKHTQKRRKSANFGGPFSKTKERLQPLQATFDPPCPRLSSLGMTGESEWVLIAAGQEQR